MPERTGIVTAGGNPVTLVGDVVGVGDAAPDFTVLDTEMNPVSFSSLGGGVRVIASVPSLDTSVCDVETRRFNDEAKKLGEDVRIITISMDLPFAQKRWCGASGVEHVKTYSDHRDASFGTSYGVLMKELRLLARAVFVVDGDGAIRHLEIVGETGHEPDYDAALAAIKELM